MNLNDYITDLNKAYQVGNATEHTYRKYLQDLVESLDKDIIATNEPARIKCGAPDYIITKKDIPLGYIEAKDIGRLNKLVEAEKRQFARYTESLDNLVYTDYIEFVFYKAGEEVSRIKIGEIVNGALKPLPENFATFTTLIKDFINYHGATIKSAKQLAKMMAGKARLMSIVINNALVKTDDDYKNQTLKEQLEAFKQILIHDIEPLEFANVYSQTIAYGMFSARLNDKTLENFSRQEAAELIPKSNPFLRKLFGYIAGPDLDDRIKWVVDSLAEIFSYTNVAEIMKNYGKSTKQTDPVIHFYETFLGEFDPALRKSRGVWYTPDPIVQFIVRAVDEVLKTEFNLPMGLADTSKTTIDIDLIDNKLKKGIRKVQKEVHKVQILDPATGTGTFLAETIKQIHSNFEGQQGIWNTYVDKHLKPRLHGFELLMASYAMAHLKLDLLLKETGYSSKSDKRLNIYLTNSLEEAHPDTGTLFANWLSNEANEANHIKREVPIMTVIGNPPYSVSSSNKGEWIQKLIGDYKKNLNERNINSLSDDYIKFIRYAEHFIEKNGKGVVGMITNNSFLDGITHRQMRKHLLETFDKIYILNLHGDARKKETCPDGSPDKNVFDIMAGVSINIFVKNTVSPSPLAGEIGRSPGEGYKKKPLATVYHKDLYGKRDFKYNFCKTKTLTTGGFKKLKYKEPYYFFVPKDFSAEKEYKKGFKVDELFPVNGSGIKFRKDNLLVKNHFSKDSVKTLLKDINTLENHVIHSKYNFNDTKDWKLAEKKNLFVENDVKNISSVLYRPFDTRYTYYPLDKIAKIIPRGDSRKNLMQNFMNKENLGLLFKRQCKQKFSYAFLTNIMCESCVFESAFANNTVFPLYIYEEEQKDLIK